MLLVMIYGVFIFILTCTKSFKDLLEKGRIDFQWESDPDLMGFFDFSSYSFHSSEYIFQKVGHAVAFSFLALLIYLALKKALVAFIMASIIGLLTEFSQLFLSRTGCLLDVGYDVLGISMFFLILQIIKRTFISFSSGDNENIQMKN